MVKRTVNKKTLLYIKIIIIFILSPVFLLTGCSDLVEVQDRDFVLALGVSLRNEEFELTFALPDISTLTKDGKKGENEGDNGQIRTYEGITLSEIEDIYNHGSNKRLDFRHLETLILDETISSSSDMLQDFFEYIDNNYQISRNVQVFYYPGDAKELIETKGKIGGSIGDYLKKLEKNNQQKNNIPSVTVGNIIDSFSQNKGLIIPLLELKEDKLEIKGAAVFQGSIYVKQLTDEELDIYYVIKGRGKELNFHTPNNLVFKLTEFKSNMQYLYQNNKPVIRLSITGTADPLFKSNNSIDTVTEINHYLKDAILDQITICLKEDKIDYFNLYDGSSIKNRDIWLKYQNRRNEFADDVTFNVNINIKVQ